MQQNQNAIGLQCYQNHEYISALKHFTHEKTNHPNLVSVMAYQTFVAITNMQLCNYNQATQQLNQLRIKLSNYESHNEDERKQTQVNLIKIKVLANLMIIYLVNCKQSMEKFLKEAIQIIEDNYNKEKHIGKILFKALIKSLFGLQSFSQLQTQTRNIVQKIEKRINIKQLKDQNHQISHAFLSTLSIYTHLTGQLDKAIALQNAGYELAKNNNPIIAALSLRHLQELQKQRSNEKQRRYYHQQLMIMMSNSQLQGIAEETLFRNYSLKVKEGQTMVKILIEKQQYFMQQQIEKIKQHAMLWKLKRLRNGFNAHQLNPVIYILQKDASIFKIMGQTDLIRQAEVQFSQSLSIFLQLIQNVRSKKICCYYQQILDKIRNFQGHYQSDNQNRIIDINLTDINCQQSERQYCSRRRHTPSKDKKHEFATSFYLPTKNLSNLKSQTKKDQQDYPNSLHLSRLTVKPPITHQLNEKKYLQYRQQRNNEIKIYKIGKNQSNKDSIISQKKKKVSSNKSNNQQQNQIKRSNKIGSSIQNSKKTKVKKMQNNSEQSENSHSFKEYKISFKNQRELQIISDKLYRQKLPRKQQGQHRHQQENHEQSHSLNDKSQQKITKPNFTRQKQIQLKQSKAYFNIQTQLLKSLNHCIKGQFVDKRHFSSEGGSSRYLELNHKKDYVYCSKNKQFCDQSHSFDQIKGIIFGKVTQVMMNESNQNLQPWKCFSLVLKKRTLDIYCRQQKHIFYWLQGLSSCLKELTYENPLYHLKTIEKIGVDFKEKVWKFGNKQLTRYYSAGRVLWKKLLMKLQMQYLKSKRKDKRRYFCANAYAIVVAAIKIMGYKPQTIQRTIII